MLNYLPYNINVPAYFNFLILIICDKNTVLNFIDFIKMLLKCYTLIYVNVYFIKISTNL